MKRGDGFFDAYFLITPERLKTFRPITAYIERCVECFYVLNNAV